MGGHRSYRRHMRMVHTGNVAERLKGATRQEINFKVTASLLGADEPAHCGWYDTGVDAAKMRAKIVGIRATNPGAAWVPAWSVIRTRATDDRQTGTVRLVPWAGPQLG